MEPSSLQRGIIISVISLLAGSDSGRQKTEQEGRAVVPQAGCSSLKQLQHQVVETGHRASSCKLPPHSVASSPTQQIPYAQIKDTNNVENTVSVMDTTKI